MIRGGFFACLLIVASLVSTAGTPTPPAHAATVMVIEDFAPMRMVPSSRAPRKAYAPLGLLLKTRRVSTRGNFIEATNGEQKRLEDPAWLHYWLSPNSILAEPGATEVSLDLIVLRNVGGGGGGGDRGAGGGGDFSGRRYSVDQFLADSTALPDSYYVVATNPDDRSPWGGDAEIFPPDSTGFQPDGPVERKSRLRSERRYHLSISLTAPKRIRSVRERVAVARVLVKAPACNDFEYVETEVATIEERTRKVGAQEDRNAVAVSADELTTTTSAAGVQWSRLVYVADVTFEDGTTETIARRLFVWWPLCM